VRLALLGRRDALKGDAAHHAGRWAGQVEALTPAVLDGAAPGIDALFGAGLARPLYGGPRALAPQINAPRSPCIGVDVPSGVFGDTGQTLGDAGGAPRCVATVTFFHKKPGHLLLPGRALCGEVIVADIGIPDTVVEPIAPRTYENDPALWADRFPW